ncbi:Uncharacterized protein dnm_073460 [Desulfonema magnum]|uniref:Uncharacterized protein n=1 Tax=Desulfonema magnum TaxID=45655 RepID=A0A975BTZ9_9BACT|nr:Uncharacterized protein dnm_073460 [Desulfonema magnum]
MISFAAQNKLSHAKLLPNLYKLKLKYHPPISFSIRKFLILRL